MIKGFGLLEVLVTMTLSAIVLTIVIANVSESAKYSQKAVYNQQLLESIFHAVDTLRSDLTRCGMRLQEAGKHFDIPLFEHAGDTINIRYGMQSEVLQEDAYKGERIVHINRNDHFGKKKKVLIYDIDHDCFEFNEIAGSDGDCLEMVGALQNDYFKNAYIVVVKEVAYKLYAKQRVLKRKLNGGYFQPLTENVTDFYVKFYPDVDSVYYRIEVKAQEQVRGYIFLANMVPQ